MADARVSLVASNEAQRELLAETARTLDEFGVPHAWSADAAIVVAAYEDDGTGVRRLAGREGRVVLGVPMTPAALEGFGKGPATAAATLAVGKAGAINAGLMAVAILANGDCELAAKLTDFRRKQTEKVMGERL